MELKSDKKDWRALKNQKKKQKLDHVEKYLETKRQIEVAEEKGSLPHRKSSLAIAIAGSIVDNIQTEELATYLAGQIARAAAIYKVDEVIVFDDTSSTATNEGKQNEGEAQTWQNCIWLAKILQYLECPQYLRKSLFPLSRDFRFTGLLNPLDTPHHLRQNSLSIYREGVILDEVHPQLQQSYVNVGQTDKVRIDQQLEPGLRVTVKLSSESGNRGTVVHPREPKVSLDTYWGYEVRLARTFSSVFTECPHKKGYNLTIGTSDKGQPLSDVIFPYKKKRKALVVIGGLRGLEFALENDTVLKTEDASLVFDYYVNVCPGQGCRTIRSEEALLISLALITDKLNCSVYSH